jgi:DeoR family transcriptional regulator of aga operon
MSHTHVFHRRERILQILRQQQQATVDELAQHLEVSGWTIRRDLEALEKVHPIRRFHGGAELARNLDDVTNFEVNANKQTTAKVAIGRKAAQLITSGQFIALAAGTTTTQVGLALRGRRDIAIMTNALNIAQNLSRETGIRLTCAGGEVHGDYYTLTGPVTERTLNTHYYDLAVIGVSGISMSEGFTVTSPTNAAVLDIMLRNARKRIIVADHTKCGLISYAVLAKLSQVDVIVTDRPAPSSIHQHLQDHDIQIITAPPS